MAENMSRGSSPDANRAQSPTTMNTDELLKLILMKVNDLESNVSGVITNINVLGKENDNRMPEIQKVGRSLGFKGGIVTDKSEPEITEDVYEDNDRREKRTTHTAEPRMPLKPMPRDPLTRTPHGIDNSASFNPLPTSPLPHSKNDQEREFEQVQGGIDFIPGKDIVRTINQIKGYDDGHMATRSASNRPTII